MVEVEDNELNNFFMKKSGLKLNILIKLYTNTNLLLDYKGFDDEVGFHTDEFPEYLYDKNPLDIIKKNSDIQFKLSYSILSIQFYKVKNLARQI